MKKRIVSVLLVMAMCVSMSACGSKGAEKKSDGSASGQKKVAVVYAGNLGDKSYNDSCNEGAKKAEKELGVKVKTLEGTTADEWEANFLAAAEGGYDLVLCSNSNFEEYLKKYAADYPDVTIHEVPAEHNPAKVQTQIEEILTANPDEGSIAGIFGTYDQLVSGASEAIRRAGRGDEIKMIGIDGDVLGFQMLFQEDSPFISTVVMDTESIGKQSAEVLLGVMNGEVDPATVNKKIPASCYVATRKNGVEAAEMKWGKNFWEDAGLVKEDVEKAFPKKEEVVVTLPSIP